MKKCSKWLIQNSRLDIFWPCLLLLVFGICAPCHGQVSLGIDTDRSHDLEISVAQRVCTIRTTGEDPWLVTHALTEPRSQEAGILSFEYFCPQGVDHLQVFYGDPAREERSYTGGAIGSAEGWVPFTLDLRDTIGDWGRVGDVLRLDLGTEQPGAGASVVGDSPVCGGPVDFRRDRTGAAVRGRAVWVAVCRPEQEPQPTLV